MAIVEATRTEELLATVQELEPLIRSHSDEAERELRLSVPVAEAMRDAGFFRLFRPESRGGFGLDPASEYRIAEAIARIDSAAAWNIQVCNAGELFGGWFSDAVTEEVFGAPDSILAGAFNPHRRADVVDGGYRISGRTGFNSGCHNANWFLGLADIYDGDTMRVDETGAPTVLLTLIPASDCEIIDNWNTLGMRGTGSHDVTAEDVFVPEERAVPFAPLERPSDAYDTPLFPLAIWATLGCHSAVALGVARAAIDDLVALGQKVPAYTVNSLRDRSVVQLRLAQAEAELTAARALFYSTYEEAWTCAREGVSALEMPMKARCQLASTHAAIAAARVVDLVHACVGASGIRNEQNFQKHFRDAHVITQHAFISESRLEAVGQIMFGLEPDWPFFAF